MRDNIIIIGAGLGGLSAGALLAGNKKKVRLFERHAVCGGYATTFRRRLAPESGEALTASQLRQEKKPLNMEVALHLIGDLSEKGMLSKIMREIGILERVEMVKTRNLFKCVFPDREVLLTNQTMREEHLSRIFPEEREGLREIFCLFGKIREEMVALSLHQMNNLGMLHLESIAPEVYKHQHRTLDDMLAQFLKSPQLKSIIGQYWFYCGCPPSTMSAVYYAYVWTEYLAYGGYYPKYRSQDISDAMQDIIEENGGNVHLKSPVKKILCRDNTAYGIETVDGREYYADCVVSNVNPQITFQDMLDPDVLPKRYREKISKMAPSLSCFQVFLHLNVSMKEVYGEEDHEIFINEYYDIEQAVADMDCENYSAAPYYITIYENIIPEYHQLGHSTLTLMQLSRYEPWRDLSPSAYQEKKVRHQQLLIKRLEKRYPKISDHIELVESSTPLTNEKYTANTQGAMCGAAHTVQQSLHKRLPQVTPLKNLYLAGAWTRPGAGFSGTIWSGYQLAQRILGADK